MDREAQVKEAAAALDVVRPGWAHRVDIGRLRLMNPQWCILGQVFRPVWWKPQTWTSSAYLYGNQAVSEVAPVYMPVFAAPWYQDAWISEIADRVIGAETPAAPVLRREVSV